MFTITEEDENKIKEWDNNHKCTLDSVGAIGGRLKYCFTPTGLGVIKTVKCACGEMLDYSDYDSW